MAKKTKNVQFFEGIGRRKESVARVRLYLVNREKTAQVEERTIKAGDCVINGKALIDSQLSSWEKTFILVPLKLTESIERFAVSIHVSGGGKNGQIEAMVHGLARAIDKVDQAQYRPILRREGLLTRDPRHRERRKVGTGGKARRVKQSPKR
jgi:small subunit ribosomal protein S9